MPLSDLVRAIPGVVVFGLLPGLGLATCLAPRWSTWLRLAAAPGLSAGTVGILGLLAHDANVPFRAWWVGVLTAALLAGAGWRLRRAVTKWAPDRRRFAANAPQLVALGCGVLLAATVAVAMRGEPVPIDADPAVHAAVAERIAAQGDILPVIANPVDGSAAVRPRSGVEAVAAFAASVGAPSATQALLPIALLGILLAPLSVALLALELTGNRAIAILAPLLGAGFPYPAVPTAFGEIPLVVDSTLVIPLAIAALRLARGDIVKQNAAMLFAAVASIWAVHGTEVLTAGVIAIPVALVILGQQTTREQRVAWLKGAAIAIGVLAAAAIFVTFITRLPRVPPGIVNFGSGTEVPEATVVGGGVRLVDFPADFINFVFPSRIWLVAYLSGLAATLKFRPLRGLFVAHLAFALILADVSTRRVLLPVYERVFPWSEPDRLASDQYWVLPVLLAAGLVYVATVVAPIIARRLPTLARRPRQAALVAAAIVAGIALGVGHDHDARSYAIARASVGMVSATDLDVMHRMAARLPPGTPVMADGIDDAGQWIIALTPDLLYMSKDHVVAHPSQLRIQAVARACDNPDAARQALSGAGAIFVGSRERFGAKAHWSVDCVARIPGLRLLAREGMSAAFAVEP